MHFASTAVVKFNQRAVLRDGSFVRPASFCLFKGIIFRVLKDVDAKALQVFGRGYYVVAADFRRQG